MSLYLGLVIIVVLAWQGIRTGWQGLTGLLTIQGVKKRESTDISAENSASILRTQEIITSLNASGFSRLGESMATLPFSKYVTVWILTNPEKTVFAEALYGWTSLSTYFPNHALVVTDYPRGEWIEMDNYQSHTIITTINDAYQHHLDQVAIFSQKYGPPVRIENMKDYFTWEEIGRREYGNLKLRNLKALNIVRVLTAGIICAIYIAVPFGGGFPFISDSGDELIKNLVNIELLMICLTYPALLLPTWFSNWQDKRVIRKIVTNASME